MIASTKCPEAEGLSRKCCQPVLSRGRYRLGEGLPAACAAKAADLDVDADPLSADRESVDNGLADAPGRKPIRPTLAALARRVNYLSADMVVMRLLLDYGDAEGRKIQNFG